MLLMLIVEAEAAEEEEETATAGWRKKNKTPQHNVGNKKYAHGGPGRPSGL